MVTELKEKLHSGLTQLFHRDTEAIVLDEAPAEAPATKQAEKGFELPEAEQRLLAAIDPILLDPAMVANLMGHRDDSIPETYAHFVHAGLSDESANAWIKEARKHFNKGSRSSGPSSF